MSNHVQARDLSRIAIDANDFVGQFGTEWPAFRDLHAKTLAKVMKGRTIVDLRNLLDRQAYTAEGFIVHSIGRTARLRVRRVGAQNHSARAAVRKPGFVQVTQGAAL